MCGICGKISLKGKEISKKLIVKMNSTLEHRGPDDHGVYLNNISNSNQTISVGLGHQRLSIIDLSKAGTQPMSNEDNSLWMVFNGEIYNHNKLRKELESNGHRFKSKTDCEVIIHLYEQNGIECLQKLNGMFSFALWDNTTQSLFLCRDRVGIKPLVYYWDETSLIFASEIKSILCDPEVSKNINQEALNLYFTFNYTPAPHTMFEDIYKLNPGSYLCLKDKKVEIKKYWDAQTNDIKAKNELLNIETCKDRLYSLLEDSVRMRLMSDVPLGAFLSGGIDSSIIVGLMSKISSSPVNTYSIGYKDMPMFDETHYAREVAELHKTNHHEIKLESKDILNVITDILDHFDEPFADSSSIPTFIVSRETKKHVQVALSGDGGDELFAGYRMYSGEYWYSLYKRVPVFLRKGLFEPILKMIPDSRNMRSLEYIRRIKKFVLGSHDKFEDRFFAWNEIFTRDIRENLIESNLSEAHLDLGKNIFSKQLNALKDEHINRMLYADLTTSLPNDMLTKVDWMSMKNSLEVRTPLLDHRVVELAFQMQGNFKIRKGKGKHILIETFKGLLPISLLNRPKWGFEIPISQWLKSDLKFLIDEHLSKNLIKKQGIFNPLVVNKLVDDLFSNRSDTAWHLWNLIVFQAWYARNF